MAKIRKPGRLFARQVANYSPADIGRRGDKHREEEPSLANSSLDPAIARSLGVFKEKGWRQHDMRYYVSQLVGKRAWHNVVSPW